VDLWHYTCEHSRDRILEGGLLLPAVVLAPAAVFWMSQLVWLTDRPSPLPADALGLDPAQQTLTGCDRTAYRFHVLHPEVAIHWPLWRREKRPEGGTLLELAPGARPAHWWVSPDPVEVEPAFL
jgi:hypothetical protein